MAGNSRYGVLVRAFGGERHESLAVLQDMKHHGEVEFAGRRKDGKPVFVEPKQVYFWNGSCCGGGGKCIHMHVPGEVVS